ncbi:SCO family protein [Rubrivivax albus]|uniref:Cytochrome C oxidase subunit I n=1 Tax=Rubrivivax albus TaxID=2499835 RepID=A0A3S2TN47_9BURK|nr:hypothetical protein [Rubrivivax albus]RVT52098.1 hypothetical protein ENE75_06420 [Rubrivivax albus]
MSGSESSAPAGQAAPEALSFTVHSMPQPSLADRRSRVLGGRLRLLLVLLACAAPVIASYFTYYVIRPDGRTNYGTLIQPSRGWPADLALQAIDGAAVAPAALRGQWLLVTVGDAACDASCEKHLYMQRQLREMLGRERDRVDRVWLITDGGTPAQALREAVEATGPVWMLRVDRAVLARWLAPADGQALGDHLYIVDPMGEWMMRMPADPTPQQVKRDLDRLLRASSSWDRAGRE